MLGKLLKYDLRYIYKILGIWYLVDVASAAIGALLLNITNPPFLVGFIGEFLSSMSIGLAVGLVVNAFTRTWVRFRQNLYGDEAYLTHTLPISRFQLFASKFISAIITLLASAIVVAIVALIYLHNVLPDLDLFEIVLPGTSITLLHCVITLGLLVIMQSIFIIMCGLSGIVIGHRFDSARGIISFIAGFACYVLIGGLLIGIIYLCSAFDPELSALLTSGHQPSLPTLLNCAWLCTAIYTTVTTILFAVNVNLLQRGVDVE